jgi:two-component system, OmpR family, sensor histidine kinase QseC
VSGRLPSIVSWVVLTVLAAVVALFVVIYAFNVYRLLKRESGDNDQVLQSMARVMATALDSTDSDETARAAIASQRVMMSAMSEYEPTDPPVHLVAARRDGSLRVDAPARSASAPVAAPDLSGIDVWALAEGVNSRGADTSKLTLYVGSGQHWRVVVVDDAGLRQRWTLWLLLKELLGYLALCLLFTLLPVWLAVRAALKPVLRLSNEVAARSPQDTQALRTPASHRELLPLQTALNRLFERVAHGLAREKAFVHDAAHELRTPLAVIATQAHVLAQADANGRAEAGRRLHSAVTRASHLSHQLLRLAQADASSQAQRQHLDVMNVVREVLAGFTERAQAQGSELALQGPDNLVVRTDARAMHSILENLVDNALRYGGAGRAVEVQVTSAGAGWQISVTDRGPGMAAEHRERAFERFWRGHTGQERGTGLGLAIVREAARSLSGQVRISEGLGRVGCCVTVTLP